MNNESGTIWPKKKQFHEWIALCVCFYSGATVVWPRPHWRHSVVYQGFTGITHMHIYIRAAVRGALDFSLRRIGKGQWLRLYLATQLIVLWQVTSVLLSFLPFLAKTETDKPNALNKFVENLLGNWTRTMANQEGIFVDETFHCAHHNRICHSSFFLLTQREAFLSAYSTSICAYQFRGVSSLFEEVFISAASTLNWKFNDENITTAFWL